MSTIPISYLFFIYMLFFSNNVFGETISLNNLEKCFLNPEKCEEYMDVNKSKRINKKNNQLDLEMPKLKLKPYTIIGKRAFISGYAIDNDGIAELSINNKVLFFNHEGYFEHSIFIPSCIIRI